MNAISRTIKRGFAAVFGGSGQTENNKRTRSEEHGSSKRRKMINGVSQPSMRPLEGSAASNGASKSHTSAEDGSGAHVPHERSDINVGRKILPAVGRRNKASSDRKPGSGDSARHRPELTCEESHSPGTPSTKEDPTDSALLRELDRLPRYPIGEHPLEQVDRVACLISTQDGEQNRPALIMTEQLLQQMRSSLEESRMVEVRRLERKRRLRILDDFLEYAERELAHLPSEYRHFRRGYKRAAEAEQVVETFEELRRRVQRAEEERKQIDWEFQDLQNEAELSQAKTDVLLQNAFCRSGLMVGDGEIALRSNASAAEEFAVGNRTALSVIGPMDIEWDFAVHSPSQGDLEGENTYEGYDVTPGVRAKGEFWNRYDDLQRAQARFDRRDRETAEASFRRRGRYRAATTEDLLEFDLAQLHQNNKLTRELIEAEQRFAAAKRAAVDERLDLAGSQQTSGFGKVDGDVDRAVRLLSETRDPAETAGKDPIILAWLTGVPEYSRYHHIDARGHSHFAPEEESFLWECTSLVKPQDSGSVVNSGGDRARIDQVSADRKVFRKKVGRHWKKHTAGPPHVPHWNAKHTLAGRYDNPEAGSKY